MSVAVLAPHQGRTFQVTISESLEADDDDDPPRYADPEDFGGHMVRIFVDQADGKSKGGFFKDGPWHENRWHGPPEPNRQQDMICHGDLETAPWFLIQYVLPRRVTGSAANDSFVDVASVACWRTPIQALHWFSRQDFGPPPALVERVRRFAAEWPTFCSSRPARAMIETLLQRGSVPEQDVLFSGDQREVFALLKRLELLSTSHSGGEVSYDARGLVQDFGIDGYIAWTNQHLSPVAFLIAEPRPSIASSAAAPSAAARPVEGPVAGVPPVPPPPPRMSFDYRGTSEIAVLAVVRAIRDLRTRWPDTTPKKYRIKDEAGKAGGAGDVAIDFANAHGLITPDFRLTDAGARFLAERS